MSKVLGRESDRNTSGFYALGVVCFGVRQIGRNDRLALNTVVGKESQTEVCSLWMICATIAPGNESFSRC